MSADPATSPAEVGVEVRPPEVVSPELIPLSPAEQKLLDAITLPEKWQNDVYVDFREAIDIAMARVADPKDQEALATAASMIEWEWFAKRGDPLPDGIAIDKYGCLTPQSKRLAAQTAAATKYLETGTLNGVIFFRHSLQIDAEMDHKFAHACAELAQETDIYKLLRTIASDAPQPTELPLSAASRMIRESQIDDDVRRRHGLERMDAIQAHPNANRELHRSLLQLDEETEWRRKQEQADARGRLMDFLTTEFNAWGSEGYDKLPPICTFYSEDGEIYGRDQEGNEFFIGSEQFLDFSWHATQRFDKRYPLEDYIDNRFIMHRLVKCLIDPDLASTPVLDLLEDCSYGDGQGYFYSSSGRIKPAVLLYLRGADADVIQSAPYTERTAPWVQFDNETTIEVCSQEIVQSETSLTIGLATGRLDRAASHLVMPGRNTKQEYPTFVEDADLVISLNGFGEALFVPGFELVARGQKDGHYLYYFQQAEVDPYYGSADVKLEDNNVQSVIEYCENIGFTELANQLRSAEDLSLADLVAHIQQASDYTYDANYRRPKQHYDSYSPEVFADLINEDGRLQVQCTGASAFLETILEVALPTSRSSTIAGHKIHHYGSIGYVGHAQTLVSYEGEQYILDATPRSGTNESMQDDVATNIQRRQSTGERRHPVGPREEERDEALPVMGHTSEERNERLQEQVRAAPERARRLVKAHFNLPIDGPDDRLYKAVAALKKDADPLRRVIEHVLRYDKDHRVDEAVGRTARYLASLTSADTLTIRRIGIPAYDSSLLAALQQIVIDLRLPPEAVTIDEVV